MDAAAAILSESCKWVFYKMFLGTLMWLNIPCISLQNSSLNNKICWPILYSHGEGPFPWVRPRSSGKGWDSCPPPKMMQADLPEPSTVNIFIILGPNPKNLYAWSMKELLIVSNALAWSIDTIQAGIPRCLQWPIASITFIKTSWMYLLLVKPFCAREKIKSLTFFNRLFKARERTLNIQESRLIGRQLVNWLVSPFLGISFINPVLKPLVSLPFVIHQLA